MDTDIHVYRLPEIAPYYPQPRVPMLPVVSGELLSLSRPDPRLSRFFQADVLPLSSGRMAFYYALTAAGLTAGDEVLVPAYHCGSMLEPLIWLGLKPVLFPLREDLTVTPELLEAHLGSRCRALLLPHFFGFPQPLATLRQFCQQKRILLIEDCAHSFFSTADGLQLGYVGDFSIASSVKFFPGSSGGALACNNPAYRQALAAVHPPSLTAQLKALLNPLETAASYDRLGWWPTRWRRRPEAPGRDQGSRLLKRHATCTDTTRLLSREQLQWFDPGQIGTGMAYFHRWLLDHSSCEQIIARRRDNFRYYLKRLQTQRNIRPLHDRLPEQIVPYVFPLLLSLPKQHFPRLKMRGVPIWRWEELADSVCGTSQNYRLKLLQLPCHQSLQRRELDWIIDQLILVVGTVEVAAEAARAEQLPAETLERSEWE